MATRILMPKLGLTMTEGTITEWVVSAGEKVSKGSTVMLIETDKVEAEVEAEARNYFREKVYTTVIPRNVRLSEAPSHGMPVLYYDKTCPGSIAYLKFIDEFMSQDNKVETAA